ncbi:MAG: thiolase family protein [Phycisphaeraceae bacterium]|nr:MAG: thiolase family protein [Phycisphaeraceae bacterium]
MSNQPVIVAAKRTPVGRFLGGLSRTKATQLGAYAVEAALREVPDAAGAVDEVIMGCVLQAGLGQNPARQAALGAGLPPTTPCYTVNKVCGSGLKSVMLAAQAIRAGDAECVVAGGLENMSLAPHMATLRAGAKFGPVEFADHMQADGLTCAFEKWGMGSAAEWIASEFKVTREEQDAYSARSHQRAAEATEKGWFRKELIALSASAISQKQDVNDDEGFRADTSIEKLAALRPAFQKDGSVTAGNASQISDGAAAVVVMSESRAEELGLEPLARIVGSFTSGTEPKALFTAPVLAITELMNRTGTSLDKVDLFEINEAFAAQVLQNQKKLGISDDKLNLCGGGIALGHPIGASGARVLTTLIHQMIRLDKKRGVASLCLGGGNAVAMMIER